MQNYRPFFNRKSLFFQGQFHIISAFPIQNSKERWHFYCNAQYDNGSAALWDESWKLLPSANGASDGNACCSCLPTAPAVVIHWKTVIAIERPSCLETQAVCQNCPWKSSCDGNSLRSYSKTMVTTCQRSANEIVASRPQQRSRAAEEHNQSVRSIPRDQGVMEGMDSYPWRCVQCAASRAGR